MTFDAFKARYQQVPVEEYPNRVRDAVPDPTLSVHVLTYQHADYIRQAIESVLMQEVDVPLEIVIGDDDSSDGTREICKEYADAHPDTIRLLLHRRENNIEIGGRPSHVFQYWYNTFSLRGRYLAILSGDDYWTDPRKLQTQVEFLDDHPAFALSFHDAHKTTPSGERTGVSIIPDANKRDLSRRDLLEGPNLQPLTVVARHVFDDVPAEVFSCLNEDIFMTCLLGEHGKAHYHPGIDPAVYRKHDGGVWTASDEAFQVRERIRTTRHLIAYLRRTGQEAAVPAYARLYGRLVVRLTALHLDRTDGGALQAVAAHAARSLQHMAGQGQYREMGALAVRLLRLLLGHVRKRAAASLAPSS